MAAKTRVEDEKTHPDLKDIMKVVKGKCFSDRKFYKGEDGKRQLVVKTLKLMDASFKDGKTPEEKAKVEAMITYYGEWMKGLINGKRNYQVQQMKKACISWMAANDGKMPAEHELKKVFGRIPNAKESLFKWYWDEFLACTCSAAKDWSDQFKYFGTITEQGIITPHDEAFGMVCIDNYGSRWEKEYEFGQSTHKQVKIVDTKKASTKDTAKIAYFAEDEHAELKTKWTNSNAGSDRDGGWERDGMVAWVNYRKQAKAIRAKPETVKVEKVILTALRAENDISVDTYLEWRNSKKPKVDGPAEEDYAFLAEDDDIDCAPVAPVPEPTTTNGTGGPAEEGGEETGTSGS